MRTCSQCRFATRGHAKGEKICMVCPDAPQCVDADAYECGRYEVSAYAFLDSIADAQERILGKEQKAKLYQAHFPEISEDLREEAEALRSRYALARRMIGDMVNPEWRKVVHMRHMERKTWEEIARKLLYDVRQVHRIEGKAMRDIQRQMDAHGVKR